MLNIADQVLSKMVQSGRAPIVTEAQMRDIVQVKSLANIIIQAVLSNTGFHIAIAETVCRLLDRAVDECRLWDNEEAWTARRQIKTM